MAAPYFVSHANCTDLEPSPGWYVSVDDGGHEVRLGPFTQKQDAMEAAEERQVTPNSDLDVATLWSRAEAARAQRAAEMPTEQDAINAMQEAYQRLRELGWSDAIYCPKDGSVFAVIEAGNTGIHECSYWGEWPNGGWWVHAAGDLWPSRPTLYRALEVRTPRFPNVSCSNCGASFGPGDHGFSHCENHRGRRIAR